jgi:hypothetical protein
VNTAAHDDVALDASPCLTDTAKDDVVPDGGSSSLRFITTRTFLDIVFGPMVAVPVDSITSLPSLSPDPSETVTTKSPIPVNVWEAPPQVSSRRSS